jgi:hypothetical protein
VNQLTYCEVGHSCKQTFNSPQIPLEIHVYFSPPQRCKMSIFATQVSIKISTGIKENVFVLLFYLLNNFQAFKDSNDGHNVGPILAKLLLLVLSFYKTFSFSSSLTLRRNKLGHGQASTNRMKPGQSFQIYIWSFACSEHFWCYQVKLPNLCWKLGPNNF